MKRLLFVLAVLALSAAAAWADVTVTMSMSVNAAQMSNSGTTTSYAKGTKFATDTQMAGQNTTLLTDAAAKQQWMINHVTKQIEAFDPQRAMGALPLTLGDAKVSVTPNGQTREILGRTCQGYTVDVTLPVTMAGESLVLRLYGTAWAAKDGAGIVEFRAAQKAITDLGMSASALTAQGPQARAMAEASKAFAEAGVIMEQELQLAMEGTGQMAQMLAQVGGMTLTTKVTAITTDPIPDSKFALPEGYTKK